MSDTPQQVLVDITIAAPVETVWTALRDPDQIKEWFGWDAATLVDEIKFIFLDNAAGDEARGILQFGEWEGSSDRVELTETAGGTRLRLVRSGGALIDWTGIYEDISQGWINFFQQLRLALELHPGKGRRTIFLSGSSKAGVAEPSKDLGLDATVDLAPGVRYAIPLATGDRAAGEVWYQTHFQTGLTVEPWGNGLLVVTDKGISPTRPYGGGSVLLTTYGLSDADYTALEQRWTTWWNDRYSAPSI